METQKVNYAIYPSVLDAFLRYKKRDDDETFNSLFEKINKFKTPQTEQQSKGIEFEKCVNAVIDKEYVDTDETGAFYLSGGFQFKIEVIDELASKLGSCTKRQEYLHAVIETPYGLVRLYGLPDFSFPEMLADLKTTENYKCNKYKDNTQHPMYSFIKSLRGFPIKAFKYVVSDFERNYQETYIPTEKMHKMLLLTIYEFINFIEYYRSHITDIKIFGGE